MLPRPTTLASALDVIQAMQEHLYRSAGGRGDEGAPSTELALVEGTPPAGKVGYVPSSSGTRSRLPVPPAGNLVVVKGTPLTPSERLLLSGEFIPFDSDDAVLLGSDGKALFEVSRQTPGGFTFIPARLFGAVPGTGIDMTAKIQAALNGVAAGSTVAFDPGIYSCSAPILKPPGINMYAVGAVFHFGVTALADFAFTAGIPTTSSYRDRIFGLVVKRTITNVWSSVMYNGVRIQSCIECEFDIEVEGFDIGVMISGGVGASGGCYLNDIRRLKTTNCRYHLVFDPGPTGFVNDNTFYSWRCQIDSGLGTAADLVSPDDGAEYLRMIWSTAVNQPNNNRFIGCDLEAGAGRPVRRKIRCEGASNHFIACRYETLRPKGFVLQPGTGIDGVATFDGVAVPLHSTLTPDGNYLLTGTANYTNVNITAGVIVDLAGHTLYYNGILINGDWIDRGYDITIGDHNHSVADFQDNTFFYGYDLRAIVVTNGALEFLDSTGGGANNRNHFYSEWGIWLTGGTGLAFPTIKLQGGGGTDPLLEAWTPGANSARRLAVRAVGLATGAAHGSVTFYNATTLLAELYGLTSGEMVADPKLRAAIWMRTPLLYVVRSSDLVDLLEVREETGGVWFGDVTFRALRSGDTPYGKLRFIGGRFAAGPPVEDKEPVAFMNTSSGRANSFTVRDSSGAIVFAARASRYTDDYASGSGWAELRWWHSTPFNPDSAATTPPYHSLWLHNVALGASYPLCFRRGLWINQSQVDADTRISSQGDINCFYLDASTDSVGVGTDTPAKKFDVNGGVQARGDSNIKSTSTAAFTVEKADGTDVVVVDTANEVLGVPGTGGLQVSAGPSVLTGGQLALKRRTDAGSPSLTGADYYVGLTDLSAPRTVSLAPAVDWPSGGIIVIKDESGACSPVNTITINADSTETIDGALTKVGSTPYCSMTLVSDETSAWFIVHQTGTWV